MLAGVDQRRPNRDLHRNSLTFRHTNPVGHKLALEHPHFPMQYVVQRGTRRVRMDRDDVRHTTQGMLVWNRMDKTQARDNWQAVGYGLRDDPSTAYAYSYTNSDTQAHPDAYPDADSHTDKYPNTDSHTAVLLR